MYTVWFREYEDSSAGYITRGISTLDEAIGTAWHGLKTRKGLLATITNDETNEIVKEFWAKVTIEIIESPI